MIDAKSGVSGAGRAAEEEMAVVKETDDTKPYKVAGHRHTPEITQELTELAGGNGAAPGQAGLTFVPHLMPYDQGELVSYYVRTSEPIDAGACSRSMRSVTARSRCRGGDLRAPGVSGVRGTNLCRIHLAQNEASGRAMAFASIDNLWKGAASQAIQNLNLMLRPPRVRDFMSPATQTFFRSRWVTPPPEFEQLDPAELAPGFRAAGVACGLKGGGETDVGVLACDADEVSSALALTRNAAAAAPVRVCRQECDADALRAVAVNSGNANAATGEQGYRDALAMRDAAAEALGVEPRSVAVAETGTIGVPLDIEAVTTGILEAVQGLSTSGGEDFSQAIMTTDRGPKRCAIRAGEVTVSAQAKGAGMIEPGFATMLCFVQTDAVIGDPDKVLRSSLADSMERITVDGQMSTNDTVMLQATGSSGAAMPRGLLEAVLLQLALEIVADGEGATRVGRAVVTGARNAEEAERVARAIANLARETALFGRDSTGAGSHGPPAWLAGRAEGRTRQDSGADSPRKPRLSSVNLRRGEAGRTSRCDLTHDYVGSTPRPTRPHPSGALGAPPYMGVPRPLIVIGTAAAPWDDELP